MLLSVKPAVFTPSTILLSIDAIGADVSIYTLEIVTLAAKFARCHAAYVSQCSQFILGWSVVVIMCAWIIGAIISKKVDITHLEFFDTLDLVRVVLTDWVDALAIAIALHLLTVLRDGLRSWRWRCYIRWSCHRSGSPAWCRGIQSASIGGRRRGLAGDEGRLIRRLILRSGGGQIVHLLWLIIWGWWWQTIYSLPSRSIICLLINVDF